MRVKTSVTLPTDPLTEIDRGEPNRSAFFGKAARKYRLDVEKARCARLDASILARISSRLNEEAADLNLKQRKAASLCNREPSVT